MKILLFSEEIYFEDEIFRILHVDIKKTVMVCMFFFSDAAGLNICQSKFIGNKSFVYAVLWPMRFEIDIE